MQSSVGSKAKFPQIDVRASKQKAKRQGFLLIILYLLSLAALSFLTYSFLQLCFFGYINYKYSVAFSLQLENFWNFQFFAAIAAAIFIALGSIAAIKYLILLEDPEAVLSPLGARLITRESRIPLEKILLRVVDELAIATAVHAPVVCVLDGILAINAFTIGTSADDATIVVTQGFLECLDRAEMQAVMAHEFYHIIHKDIEVNIGLLAVGTSLNFFGFFFSSLIQAVICRKRELLTDAAAVKLTTNPAALAGVLKKVAAIDFKSSVRILKELNHLFFANLSSSWWIFSAHPSLKARIYALEPTWDGAFPEIKRLKLSSSTLPVIKEPEPGKLVFAESLEDLDLEDEQDLISILDYSKDSAKLMLSREILAEITLKVFDKLKSPQSIRALLMAMLLNDNAASQKRQMELIYDSVDENLYQELIAARGLLLEVKKEHYVPLIRLAIPGLRGLAAKEYQGFIELLRQLIKTDHKVSLFEYCLYQMLRPTSSTKSSSISYQQACDVLFESLRNQIFAYSEIEQAVRVVAQAEYKTKHALVADLMDRISEDGVVTLYEEQFISAVCSAIGVDLY